jgi:large subunit ribosomal protein L25
MANQKTVSAQTRTGVGRSAVNKLKRQGFVPAVVYGGKDQPLPLQVNAREIGTLLSRATSEHILVDLQIADGGQTSNRLALIQQVQHDPIRGSVLHVDFHAVRADEKIHAQIPVEPFGEPAGVKNSGGILEIALHLLSIECFPRDLPELIRIDVSALEIGQAVHVKNIALPAGVLARHDPELTVARVAAPAVEVEPTPAADALAAAGPEVIKEKKEEAAPAPAAGDKKAAPEKKAPEKK